MFPPRNPRRARHALRRAGCRCLRSRLPRRRIHVPRAGELTFLPCLPAARGSHRTRYTPEFHRSPFAKNHRNRSRPAVYSRQPGVPANSPFHSVPQFLSHFNPERPDRQAVAGKLRIRATVCIELPRNALVVGIAFRLPVFRTVRQTTTGLINGNVQRRASMGPNNKAGPTKLAS